MIVWGTLAVVAMTAGLFLRRPWLVLGGLIGQVAFFGTLLYKIGRNL